MVLVKKCICVFVFTRINTFIILVFFSFLFDVIFFVLRQRDMDR